MRKNRIAALVLALLWLMGTSAALADDRAGLLEMAVKVLNWQEETAQVLQTLQDPNAHAVWSTMDNTLLAAAAVLTDAQTAENDFTGKTGELQGYAPEIADDGKFCASGTRWIAEIGAYCEVEVVCEEQYLSVLLTMYQNDGALVGMQKVELGRQGEEFMALLVDYDHLNWMTGRFAMLPDENTGRVIFTKTLGQTMDVVLDVKAWSEGETLESWDKDLLLPAGILYK